MSTKRAVSVVIPVYNCERFLAEAVNSVLSQTVPAREVIIIDDGSTDGSAKIAQQFSQLHYLRQENRGIGAARNAGLKLAKGEFVAFLDADDIWEERKLEWQLQLIESEPQTDLVFGMVRQFREEAPEWTDFPQADAGYIPSALLARRSAFDRIGPFTEALTIGEFIDWFARAELAGVTIRNVPGIVVHRRIHTGNTGILRRDARGDYMRVLQQALARKRSADRPAVPAAFIEERV